MKRLIWILIFLTLPFEVILAQGEVYLRIRAGTFQKLNILVKDFQPRGFDQNAPKLANLLSRVVSRDLYMSGYFNVQREPGLAGDDEQSGIPTSGPVPLELLVAIVHGNVGMNKGRINAEVGVLDARSQKAMMKKDYAGDEKAARALGHRIADDIVYHLTGEEGIASTQITYVSPPAAGGKAKEIHVMDYDGFNARQLTSDNSIDLTPAWSSDAKKIVYTSFRGGNPGLYVLDLESKRAVSFFTQGSLNTGPAWSPDGKRIVFTSTRDGNPEIYVVDANGKNLRRLTFHPGIDTSPCWSPDGKRIAFTSDRSGAPQIYIMDADGTNLRRLTYQGSYNDSPAWSPKGDKIAYVSREDTGFQIYTIDVTGENVQKLTDRGSNEDPSWSPDGFHIVFSSTRDGRKEIYLMNWDGSDPQRLTFSGGNFSPAWSPRIKG